MVLRKRRKVVMIIDDNPARRKRLYEVLKLTPVDLVSAPSGQEAMERVPRDQPSLILLNMESKAVDGAGFLHELRSYGMGKKITVLAMIGGDPEDRKRALAAGADGVIEHSTPDYELVEIVSKPLGIEKLEIPSR